MTTHGPTELEAAADQDDVSIAPESGQPAGGREDPWDGEAAEAGQDWPSPHHASSKDEF
jgi:hypothetical protein